MKSTVDWIWSVIFGLAFLLTALAFVVEWNRRHNSVAVPVQNEIATESPRIYNVTNLVTTNLLTIKYYYAWGLVWINGSDRPVAVAREADGRLEQFPILYPEK